MARNPSPPSADNEDKTDTRKICGIVMPIAGSGDDYPEEHWRRVRKIIQRAIERSGLRSQLVWENGEIDVIQSTILKNLYENDVIICDLSNLNSNVMLETGLRLSTKRPTIVITDKIKKPPFDISTMGYVEYQKDLEYNSIEDFIERLAAKIRAVSDAYDSGNYKSFVEQFTFETVTPSTINVSAEQYIKDQIANIASMVRRLEVRQLSATNTSPETLRPPPRRTKIVVSAKMSDNAAVVAENKIDRIPNLDVCVVEKSNSGIFTFTIPWSTVTGVPYDLAVKLVNEVIDEAILIDDIPF